MIINSMDQKQPTISPEEHQRHINQCAADSMHIATCIIDDISIHILGYKGITVHPMYWEGRPGFSFDIDSSITPECFNLFWTALESVRLTEGDSIYINKENKAIAFISLNSIPRYINSFLSQYQGPYAQLPKKPEKLKTTLDELEPQDLLLLKRDSYLGRKDFMGHFMQAQGLVDKNYLMNFRYLPHDLMRSVQATIHVANGNTHHPTWDVFYLH